MPISPFFSTFDENENFVVLVTGASGYVASHCVKELLLQGYRVCGTVRSIKCEEKIVPLRRLKYANERLTFVEADLLKAESWRNAIDGCDFVLHVASPWPIVATADTVKTAVEGTLNVLRACAACSSVKKVVLTSSCAAVNDGHKNGSQVFDETCWTNLDNKKVEYYARSKTLAERAAWNYWKSLGDSENKFAFTVLNPTFITGPVLSNQENGSATIVSRMMNFRTWLASPRACVGVVDVRDVARAHIIAMREPRSDGQRILITQQPSVWFGDMVKWLYKEFAKQGYMITFIRAPDWLVKFYSSLGFDPMSEAILPRIGDEIKFDNTKSKELLGMTYMDPRESLIEMMYSMIEIGMVKKTRGYLKRQQKFANANKSPQSRQMA